MGCMPQCLMYGKYVRCLSFKLFLLNRGLLRSLSPLGWKGLGELT